MKQLRIVAEAGAAHGGRSGDKLVVEGIGVGIAGAVEKGRARYISPLIGGGAGGSNVAAVGRKGRSKFTRPARCGVAQCFPGIVGEPGRLANVPAFGLLLGGVGAQKEIVAP